MREMATPVDKAVEDDSWRRVANALWPSAGKRPVRRGPSDSTTPYRTISRCCRRAGLSSGAGAERRVTLFNCFVMGDRAEDDMGGYLRSIFARSRADHAARRRDRLRLLDPAAQGRAGQRRRRRRVRAVVVYGCLGRDVSHHHVRRVTGAAR